MELLILALVLVGAWGWHQHRAAKRTARAVEHIAAHIAGPIPTEPPTWIEIPENRAFLRRAAKRIAIASASVLTFLMIVGYLAQRSPGESGRQTAPHVAGRIKPGYKVRTEPASAKVICAISEADTYSTVGTPFSGEWIDIEITSGPNRGCKGVVLPF